MLVTIFVTVLVSLVTSSLSPSPLTIKLSPTHTIEEDSLKGALLQGVWAQGFTIMQYDF